MLGHFLMKQIDFCITYNCLYLKVCSFWGVLPWGLFSLQKCTSKRIIFNTLYMFACFCTCLFTFCLKNSFCLILLKNAAWRVSRSVFSPKHVYPGEGSLSPILDVFCFDIFGILLDPFQGPLKLQDSLVYPKGGHVYIHIYIYICICVCT